MSYRHPYPIDRPQRKQRCLFLRTFWMEILGVIAAIAFVTLALIGY